MQYLAAGAVVELIWARRMVMERMEDKVESDRRWIWFDRQWGSLLSNSNFTLKDTDIVAGVPFGGTTLSCSKGDY